MLSIMSPIVANRPTVVRQSRLSSVKVQARNVKAATKAGVKATTSNNKPAGLYVCVDCGYIYDPKKAGGKKFEQQPDNYRCPSCQAPKRRFKATTDSAGAADEAGDQLLYSLAAFGVAASAALYYFTQINK